MSRKLKGVAAAPGIAIARLARFHFDLDFIPTRQLAEEDVPAEIARLDEAKRAASESLQRVRQELARTLSDRDSQIYDAQLALLHDKTLYQDLVREIRTDKINVEVALQRVIARYEQVFEAMQDAAMRERAADVRDVGRQMLTALLEKERMVLTAGGTDYVFVADEFLPSDAGHLDREHLRGIVTARGGKYSHGAILARSLGIPAIVGVDELLQRAESGMLVIVDGESAVVLLEPDDEEVARYEQLLAERRESERRIAEVQLLRSVTRDGTAVRLLANVESVRDLDHVDLRAIDGIGLFRTEFAFMEQRQFPAEDEQVGIYRAAVAGAKGKAVTFRTLDVGGDKPLAYFRTPQERNPVLGWRGLRICLDWPDILYAQVRAILRAGAGGHARLLLPMVSSIDEVRRCREVVDQIRHDLLQAGEPFDQDIEFGVMVEVPALVAVLDLVLPLVDFLSVGTNDLVQYLLAVDRDNPRVASLYDPYHPALVRVLKHIATVTNAAGKTASICGEIAGDHYYTALLLGLGFRELSMAPVFVPRVKLMVRSFSLEECEAMATTALGMETAAQIRRLARDAARQKFSSFLQSVQPPRAPETRA